MATTITKVERQGDLVTIRGQVDGADVAAQGWVSATAGMTKAQRIAYALGLLNAAAPATPTDLTAQFQ